MNHHTTIRSGQLARINARLDAQMAKRSAYSPAMLDAIKQRCDEAYAFWTAEADKKEGYLAQSYQNRAAAYRFVGIAAVEAMDGLDEGFEYLNEYFATDHLLIWRDAEAIARKSMGAL